MHRRMNGGMSRLHQIASNCNRAVRCEQDVIPHRGASTGLSVRSGPAIPDRKSQHRESVVRLPLSPPTDSTCRSAMAPISARADARRWDLISARRPRRQRRRRDRLGDGAARRLLRSGLSRRRPGRLRRTRRDLDRGGSDPARRRRPPHGSPPERPSLCQVGHRHGLLGPAGEAWPSGRLAELLGGRYRQSRSISYRSVVPGRAGEDGARAVAYVKEGYRRIQVKVGARSRRRHPARIEAVRAAVGVHRPLRRRQLRLVDSTRRAASCAPPVMLDYYLSSPALIHARRCRALRGDCDRPAGAGRIDRRIAGPAAGPCRRRRRRHHHQDRARPAA